MADHHILGRRIPSVGLDLHTHPAGPLPAVLTSLCQASPVHRALPVMFSRLVPWEVWQKKSIPAMHLPLAGGRSNLSHVLGGWSESCSVISNSLWPHGLYSPWNSPGQNTGVGSFSFLQGIFPTQGLNPGLLHSRWVLYQLSHEGSPRILEWVAYPFFRGSSHPRNWTGVSCIGGGFFTN